MSKLFRWTLFVLVILGLPFTLIPLAPGVLLVPEALALSAALTVVYIALILFALRFSRMWPRSAPWVVVNALLWGAGTSFMVVTLTGPSIVDLASSTTPEMTVASWAGAYPEELAKTFGVIFILLAFSQLNRPWHGFIVGMLVGLGFESFENLMYGTMMSMMNPVSDVTGVFQIWGARVILGPLLHISFTGLAGWGIGWALFAVGKSLWWRLGCVGVWWLVAFGTHFAWNVLSDDLVLTVGSKIAAAIVLYPLFIYVWIAGTKAAKANQVSTSPLYTAVNQLPPHYLRAEPSAAPTPGPEPHP